MNQRYFQSLFREVPEGIALEGITSCRLLFLIVLFAFCGGCKKFIQIDPPVNQIVRTAVFNDEGTATAALRGIYAEMMSSSGFASGSAQSVTFLAGLSADELIDYSGSGDQLQFYTNSLSQDNQNLKSALWQEPYSYISNANAIIEALQNSNRIDSAVRNQLLGEAKFIRAFCNFYLLNLFGSIPLITTTSYKQNASAARTPSAAIYQQIMTDLKDAQSNLLPDYSFSNGERDEPNKWAATAMLARVYLYTGDWENAESEASAIINTTQIFNLLSNLDSVFLKNSAETIWQLQPVQPGLNTNEGPNFIPVSTPSTVALSTELLTAFEPGDARRTNWVDSILIDTTIYYYPFKYKIRSATEVTEYSMVLRLAEQYLIRAEARAEQNKITDAQSDLNKIRNRAGLSPTTASSKASLLTAIQHERQVELFTEWGHRWLDLKRTGTAGPILSGIKAPDWEMTDTLYPIPRSEMINDKNLNQNPGY